MPTSNAAIIESSFKRFRNKLMAAYENEICTVIEDLMVFAESIFRADGYQQFTGNALNSLHAVVFVDGSPSTEISSSGITSAIGKPIRSKIKNGEEAYLSNPVEGNPRSVAGTTNEEDEYGIDTSRRVIKENSHLMPKKGVAAIIAKGVRYIQFNFEIGGQIAKDELLRKIKSLYIQ